MKALNSQIAMPERLLEWEVKKHFEKGNEIESLENESLKTNLDKSWQERTVRYDEMNN